ncbi:hypothetical protein ACFLZF_00190 [Nanoarchaeota archaeon]
MELFLYRALIIAENTISISQNACLPNSYDPQDCNITNGTGTKTRQCNSDGSAWGSWGSCTITCDTGYYESEDSCLSCDSNPSFDSNQGSSHTYSINVTSGEKTFYVDGIFSERWTEWYLDGTHLPDEDHHSWLFNSFSDPKYSINYPSGSAYILEANVYSVNQDGSWKWLEYHRWDVNVCH